MIVITAILLCTQNGADWEGIARRLARAARRLARGAPVGARCPPNWHHSACIAVLLLSLYMITARDCQLPLGSYPRTDGSGTTKRRRRHLEVWRWVSQILGESWDGEASSLKLRYKQWRKA